MVIYQNHFSLFGVLLAAAAPASSLPSNPERHFVFAACQRKQKARRSDNNGCQWHRVGIAASFVSFVDATAPPVCICCGFFSVRHRRVPPPPERTAAFDYCRFFFVFFKECEILAARGVALFGINGQCNVPFGPENPILWDSTARCRSERFTVFT